MLLQYVLRDFHHAKGHRQSLHGSADGEGEAQGTALSQGEVRQGHTASAVACCLTATKPTICTISPVQPLSVLSPAALPMEPMYLPSSPCKIEVEPQGECGGLRHG